MWMTTTLLISESDLCHSQFCDWGKSSFLVGNNIIDVA